MTLLRKTIVPLWLVVSAACSTVEETAPPTYTPPAEEADKSSETARSLNAEAATLIEKGDFEAAESLLKRALGYDLLFGPAHNNLGKVYYQRDRYYLAAWEFQYAAKLMPYRPEPKCNLGLVFEAVGKLTDAVKEYEEALRLEPDNPVVLGNLARARVRRGDRGPEVRELLEGLLLKDTRSDWRTWAHERLRSHVETP